MDDKLKRCWRCKQDLPESAYSPSHWRSPKPMRCRDCQREYRTAYYARNRESILARTKAAREADPESHRAYMRGIQRAWRERNLEHRRSYERQWADDHRESSRASGRAWADRNKDKRRAYAERTRARKSDLAKQRYAANPERWAEQGRAWYAANSDRKQATARAWRRRNPAKQREIWQRRRARIRNAQIERVDFDRILARDGWICHICGGFMLPSELSFDHIVPLSKGGAHSEENLSPAHLICNKGKSARLIESKAPPRINRKR